MLHCSHDGNGLSFLLTDLYGNRYYQCRDENCRRVYNQNNRFYKGKIFYTNDGNTHDINV